MRLCTSFAAMGLGNDRVAEEMWEVSVGEVAMVRAAVNGRRADIFRQTDLALWQCSHHAAVARTGVLLLQVTEGNKLEPHDELTARGRGSFSRRRGTRLKAALFPGNQPWR